MDKSDFLPADIVDHLKIQSPTLEPIKIELNKKLVSLKYPVTLQKKNEDLGKREREIDRITSENISTDNIESTLIESIHFMKKDELIKFINDRDLNLEECDVNQILFPTQYPNSRYEVKCLEYTMYKMLDEINNSDRQLNTLEVELESDIDLLKKLVEELNSVYQIVLHELGRQVSTTCFSRGSSIMELKEKYCSLMKRIPVELDFLKGEMVDQIQNDSDLRGKIKEFQYSIRSLTEELKSVKEKDLLVTRNAANIQKDLESALLDSERSKELLDEYHVLYDLQRQRLENQMSTVNMDKEEWTSLAFALTLKITDESLLSTSKRLRLITKKLIQTAYHFAVFVSDCDTQLTTSVQQLVDEALKHITFVHNFTTTIINSFYDLFNFIKKRFQEFRNEELTSSKHKVSAIKTQISSLKGFLVDNSVLLLRTEISEENISKLQSSVTEIIQIQGKVMREIEVLENRENIDKQLNLSSQDADSSSEENVIVNCGNIFQELNVCATMFKNDISVLKSSLLFFDDLTARVNVLEEGLNNALIKYSNIQDENIILEDIFPLIDDLYIETFENPEFVSLEKNANSTEFNRFYNELHSTSNLFSDKVDEFDNELTKTISKLDDKITQWLIKVLFLLTNLSVFEDIEVKYKDLCEYFEEIIKIDGTVFNYSKRWTEKMANNSGMLEMKKIELEEYKEVDDEWRDVAEMLLKDIEEKIEKELLRRKRKSEKLIESITFEDVENVIEEIKSKASDKDTYLAMENVFNLKEEVKDVFDRIKEANKRREEAAENLALTQEKISVIEQKLIDVTEDYESYIKD